MTVYFYHTQDSRYIQKEWKEGRFPSHLLYGACELPSEGIDVIFHSSIDQNIPRWRKMFLVARDVLRHYRHFDAVYATKQNGLDFIILLRALGLFGKPVILWHHQPILPRKGFVKRIIAKFYLSGIDHMFMFSDNIIKVSAATGLVPKNKLQQCPWGADLDFYDRMMKEHPVNHEGFISTGKERRDMTTLIEAFRNCPDQRLDIIAPAGNYAEKYESTLQNEDLPDNINVYINRTLWVPELAHEVWKHKTVCICCMESNYTVGLTTLVEALALGLPVIISKNENQPFDVSDKGCGISVPYRDTKSWQKAITQLGTDNLLYDRTHRLSRQMAETKYNINNCAHIVAQSIKELCK